MKFEKFIIRNARYIIAATVILVGLCIIPITRIKINPDLESYMPENMEARLNIKKIAEKFGNEEIILVLLETDEALNSSTLQRNSGLVEKFRNIKGIRTVYSLCNSQNITGENGEMKIEPVMDTIPQNQTDIEKLRQRIISNDLVYGVVVSKDFKNLLTILTSDKTTDDKTLMDNIFSAIKECPGNETTTVSGLPYLRNEANIKIMRDLLILLPLGVLVMFVFLWFSFKELKGVLLPISVVFISILFSLALVPLLGWNLSIVGILIPIMMIAIANNYGIHVFSRFQEMNGTTGNNSSPEIIMDIVHHLKKPVFLTGVTTMAGILGLVTHILIPAKQMGIIATISVGLALLLSITFIPAILAQTPQAASSAPKTDANHKSFIFKSLDYTGRKVVGRPLLMILVFALFLALSVAGLFRVRIAPDSNNVMPKNHPFNQTVTKVDNKFGGTKVIQLMFTGDIKDPAMLKKLDSTCQAIEKTEHVGSVNSITKIIRKISMALNDKTDSAYNTIPDTRETISQYLELYSMNGNPEESGNFTDFNYENSLVTIQYSARDIGQLNKVVKQIKKVIENDRDKFVVGGYSLVDKAISENVFYGQNYSLLFAFVVIFLLLAWIFKSFQAGLLGSLPLVFAVVCTFGIMGWLNIELNIVTALLSSISIGLGVDFTIHMFWRLKYEIQAGKNLTEAVRTSLTTIGRGIAINAFSVMLGFAVLFFSSFPIIKSFAFLIIISLALCLACALVLIPSVCLLTKPAFLFRKN